MNTELPEPNPNKENEPSLEERFASRPRLRQRLLGIADLIDQAVAEGCTAHEAETREILQPEYTVLITATPDDADIERFQKSFDRHPPKPNAV